MNIKLVYKQEEGFSIIRTDRQETYDLSYTNCKLMYGKTEIQMTMYVLDLNLYFGYVFLCLKFTIQTTYIVHITKNTQKQKNKIVQEFENSLTGYTKICNDYFNHDN